MFQVEFSDFHSALHTPPSRSSIAAAHHNRKPTLSAPSKKSSEVVSPMITKSITPTSSHHHQGHFHVHHHTHKPHPSILMTSNTTSSHIPNSPASPTKLVGVVNVADSHQLLDHCGPGGISETIVFENVNIKDCMETITDFERYPDFIDGYYNGRIVKQITDPLETTKVEYEVYLKSIVMFNTMEYTVKFIRNGNDLFWIETEHGPFKKNRGGWKLRDLENGNVEATYYVNLEFNEQVPISVKEWLSKKSIPFALRAFKKRIEEYGTRRKLKAYHNHQSIQSQRSCQLFL